MNIYIYPCIYSSGFQYFLQLVLSCLQQQQFSKVFGSSHHTLITALINPMERNLLALLLELNAFLPEHLNADRLITSYTALPIKVTLPFIMKHSSSLHCLMFLSRSASLFTPPSPPIFKITQTQQSDLLAPSSISTFKSCLSLFSSDSTGFSPGSSSWHQPPLQALVFILSLYSPSDSYSATTLSSAAPSSQESVLNSLIPLTSFPPFAFQVLSLIYLSPWPIPLCSLSATYIRTP